MPWHTPIYEMGSKVLPLPADALRQKAGVATSGAGSFPGREWVTTSRQSKAQLDRVLANQDIRLCLLHF